jgi:BolA protein
MRRIDRIKEKLLSLNPAYIEVIDDSIIHSNHSGIKENTETHMRIIISTNMFQGKSLITQHRTINHLLQDEFKSGLHALSIRVL